MSMELWQRLKDLEKKVAEHEAKLNAPVVVGVDFGVKPAVAAVTWQASLESALEGKPLRQLNAELVEDHKKMVELELRTPPDAVLRKPGPALCPKCGKAPGYYFHVKNCKGNVEVA
jgi:hypothetical protein